MIGRLLARSRKLVKVLDLDAANIIALLAASVAAAAEPKAGLIEVLAEMQEVRPPGASSFHASEHRINQSPAGHGANLVPIRLKVRAVFHHGPVQVLALISSQQISFLDKRHVLGGFRLAQSRGRAAR